jgi:hypothetical protein
MDPSICLFFVQRLQTEITQLMRQHMDLSQERDDAVAARDAAALELRSVPPPSSPQSRLYQNHHVQLVSPRIQYQLQATQEQRDREERGSSAAAAYVHEVLPLLLFFNQ